MFFLYQLQTRNASWSSEMIHRTELMLCGVYSGYLLLRGWTLSEIDAPIYCAVQGGHLTEEFSLEPYIECREDIAAEEMVTLGNLDSILFPFFICKKVNDGGPLALKLFVSNETETISLKEFMVAPITLPQIERMTDDVDFRPGLRAAIELFTLLSNSSSAQSRLFEYIRNELEHVPAERKADTPACHVDQIVGLRGGCFVRGWTDIQKQGLTAAALITRSECYFIDKIKIGRYPRGDVVQFLEGETVDVRLYGFFFFVEDAQINDSDPFILLFGTEEIFGTKFGGAMLSPKDFREASSQLFALLPARKQELDQSFLLSVAPYVAALWEATRKSLVYSPPKVVRFGEVNRPSLSVVIPMYGRLDLLKFQMAAFATDAESLRNVELLYVNDDPRLLPIVSPFFQAVYDLYGIPMTLICYPENRGYAAANNVGVNFSTAEKIVLLNSDVVIRTNGWAKSVCEALEAGLEYGILGATLLYGDGSIQHCGMYAEPDPENPLFLVNRHFAKGFSARLFAKPKGIFEVPMVTGAFLAMAKSDYQAVGGFDENYCIGDFEDSDLCLKIRSDLGKKIGVLSDLQFLHLERQSQNLIGAEAFRVWVTRVNGSRFAKRWSSLALPEA